MLIRFSVENFLSIKEKQTIDMTAVATCKERVDENTFVTGGQRLLKNVVFYGANASGKSNIFHAMDFFRFWVLSSSKDSQSSEEINIIPFFLNTATSSSPSTFEIEFLLDGKHYKYGFQANRKEIIREWLFYQENALFLRSNEKDNDTIQVEKDWQKSNKLVEITRKNALFLSVCAQFANKEAEAIISWFSQKFHCLFCTRSDKFKDFTVRQLIDKQYQNKIISFLKNADMNITDISVKENEISQSGNATNTNILSNKKIITYNVLTHHNVYDENKKIVSTKTFPLYGLESVGTQKAFALAGPIIDTLQNGGVLMIDELDTSIHPIFCCKIVNLFNSRESNPLNAQLIFNTHDTNLLSYKVFAKTLNKDENLLRRDQIYFVEKDDVESTHLYSLIDYKVETNGKNTSVRNDASFEKDYLNGRYGAIPFIGKLLEDN